MALSPLSPRWQRRMGAQDVYYGFLDYQAQLDEKAIEEAKRARVAEEDCAELREWEMRRADEELLRQERQLERDQSYYWFPDGY